jgi:hypothetical protein
MGGLSKVIVVDPDARACRQVQLGFEREGLPTAAMTAVAPLELPGDDAGLVVVGGIDGQGPALVQRVRALLDGRGIDVPIVFAGRGITRDEAIAAGADEVVLQPAYLRDVVTVGRLLRGVPARNRAHLMGNLIEVTGVYTLVRALAALGRSATLTLIRGLRRGEVRFYFGEVTSAQVGLIHGQAALHQLLLWTDARFDYHHEDVVRRHQIPLSHDELFADAERFLLGVRDSSGGLSPSLVLEPNVPRVQSLGKQIPTEVYGVLRMFDGHRLLADVLEDSAYRVFETLRVAQRAVDVGLLRVVDKQPPRASWRAVLAIEEWLVGSEAREAAAEAPVARAAAPAERDKGRKRRKKKRRTATTQGTGVGMEALKPAKAESAEIDWGALVPRIVGAEVGPLAGVVPASHVSGEIVAVTPVARDPQSETVPKVVLDDAAAVAPAPVVDTVRMSAATISELSERSRVVDDVALEQTRPERTVGRPPATTTVDLAVAETASITVIVHDIVTVEASDATTARITATPTAVVRRAEGNVDSSGATTARITMPSAMRTSETAESSALRSAVASAAPSTITDEPSDGIIRQHITTAVTTPVGRGRAPSEPNDDDRPGDATGEISLPRDRAVVDRKASSEPSILVADLAAVHSMVSAHADDRVTGRIAGNAATPAREGQIGEARADAVAFSDVEEAFFRAGHADHKVAPVPPAAPTETFEDLDEGYRPTGFWDKLRGKTQPRRDRKK